MFTSIGGRLALVLGGLLVSTSAAAEPPERTGISVNIVGGFEDFYDYGMRHATKGFGIWGVRVTHGAGRYVQLEGAYLGTAGQINAPMGGQQATLASSTFEAVARLTPLPRERAQPYLFLGVSWRHYEVTGADFTTARAGMNDSDDVLPLPMGAGLAYRYGGLIVDARFTFRATAGEDFLVEDEDYAAMDTWGMQGAVGYEF